MGEQGLLRLSCLLRMAIRTLHHSNFLARDAHTGADVWTWTPPAPPCGEDCFTTASPAIDPDRHGFTFTRTTSIGHGGSTCPFHFRRTRRDLTAP